MLYQTPSTKEKRFLIAILLIVSLLIGFNLPVFAEEVKPPASEPIDNPHTIVSSDGMTFTADNMSDTLPATELGVLEQPSFGGEDTEGNPKLIDEDVLDLSYFGETESIIGTDSRTRVTATTTFPWRATAHIVTTWRNGSSAGCTGWFIGPRTVATAGHCVYSAGNGGWASSIRVYPGRNGTSTPYGSSTSYRLFSVTGWVNSANPEYDYGAVQLNSALGNTVGWFGFRWQSSNTFSGPYRITGYPGDKTYGTMWTMEENPGIRQVTTRRLWYNIDTFGGQSGSPVYHYYSSTCTACAVAIHTYGVGLNPYTQYNSGTRITQEVFNNLVAWKNRAYP